MSDVPECAVEFEFTPEDWEGVNAAHLFRSRLQKNAIRKARAVFVWGFGAVGLLGLLAGSAATAVAWIVAGVVMGALVGPLHRRAQRKALRKLGADGVANGTFGPHRVEVREEGLVDRTPHYEWIVRWHAVEEVREHDGTFLIYNGPNCFLPIPGTAFPDAGTLRAFADGFYRRLNAAKGVPASALRGAPEGGDGNGR